MNSRRKAIAPSIAIAIILVLSAALSACGGGQASNAPVTVEAVRDSKPLTAGWRFIQDDDLTDEQALASDAASWQSVSLPHTWNAIDAAKTEQTTPTSVNYKRGLGWYHLEFDAPASGATHWLQFDGASIVADVWLNGEKLGQHRGAFTTFRFDVTGKMRRDQKNVLVVKTDNRAPANNASITAIAPLSGDFNMSGGLYRDVTLISTPHRAHIALDDFGSSGIFAHTAAIEDDHATVRVRAKLRNSTAENAAYTVRATLLEADGKTVKSTGEQTIQVAANAQAETEQDIDVPQARLWQGVADPYLYKLVVEIRSSAGDTVDKVVHDFGIRQMAFDADKGFFLNGRPVPLRGVNMHQDFLGKAWAIGKADTDLSLSLIKDMGANTVRLAHYPHARYTLQQADRMGLVVMAELPFVNSASVPGAEGCNVDPETTGFAANAREQLRELIRQQINHASIGLWSIGNEVTTIAIRCGQTDESNNVQALLRSLHAMAKTEDPGHHPRAGDQPLRRYGLAISRDAEPDCRHLQRQPIFPVVLRHRPRPIRPAPRPASCRESNEAARHQRIRRGLGPHPSHGQPAGGTRVFTGRNQCGTHLPPAGRVCELLPRKELRDHSVPGLPVRNLYLGHVRLRFRHSP